MSEENTINETEYFPTLLTYGQQYSYSVVANGNGTTTFDSLSSNCVNFIFDRVGVD
ncbi:MAG: hypothetical protein ACO2ZD_11035 [Pseudomonadales bacterium]